MDWILVDGKKRNICLYIHGQATLNFTADFIAAARWRELCDSRCLSV